MINSIQFKSFNENYKYIKFFVEIKENTYIFIVRWSNYCDCAFLSITDYEDNSIISGVALVNGLKIRTKKLPYILYFLQKNGETYEATLNNFAEEFLIIYDDGE